MFMFRCLSVRSVSYAGYILAAREGDGEECYRDFPIVVTRSVVATIDYFIFAGMHPFAYNTDGRRVNLRAREESS